MKKLLLAVFAVGSLGVFFSCTKDKAQKPMSVECSSVNADSNTYNLKIKAILDFNCAYAGCHDAFTKSSNVNLEGYAASKSAFQNTKVLCSVKQEGGCLPMPQGFPKLADSLITYMQCWAESGYAE